MSGDARNTALWQGADVFIAPENTAGPNDTITAWSDAWDVVGLLDGAEGFTEGRDGDSSEKYAWGGILFRRTNSKHKRTFKFVALEDNETTFALVNPGSTRTSANGIRKGSIKVPLAGKRFAIGFEVRDGDKVKRRIANHAEVQEVGEIKESEEDPTVYEITVVLFPDADGTLYTTIETDPDYTAPVV
jgi:hypothetical protein